MDGKGNKVWRPKPTTKRSFYDDLSKNHISNEDYDHAKLVWNTFDIRSMGQYHDICLKSDVLQLGCVFERFRDEYMFNYGLDPAHLYTSPGLVWSAALNVSKCRLQLITNPDMYLFVEARMRDGRKYVPDNILSPFRRKLWSKLNPKTKSSTDAKTRVQTRRLLCTLEDKYNYVCHYRNLQLYIKLGMKLKKVHRILEFSQSPFLKE